MELLSIIKPISVLEMALLLITLLLIASINAVMLDREDFPLLVVVPASRLFKIYFTCSPVT